VKNWNRFFKIENCTGLEISVDTSVAGKNVKPTLVGCVCEELVGITEEKNRSETM